MKTGLPSFSIKHPVTIIMVLAATVGVGLIACYRLPLKFLPEMDFPVVMCAIPYPGATPEQVEREIAIPAEEEFTTLTHLHRIQSHSDSEGCRIVMRFTGGTNMANASAEVRDRIERLKLVLPKDIEKVLTYRYSSNSMPIMAMGLFCKGDEKEFVHLVRTLIEPKLSRIEGVAEVEVFATTPEPEVLIEFDQNLLRMHNIALYQVITTLQSANLNLSAGNLTDGNTKYYVRTSNELTRPEQLAELIIGPEGLRLKEIARVGFRSRDVETHYDIDGKGGAFVIIRKESEANTVSTCKAVRKELETIKADPVFEGMSDFLFFDQSDMILASLSALVDAGRLGGILAVAVLYAFLLRLRPTFVVALAIPTSFLAALAYMLFAGMTLNIVTMTSLIVGVGMLVDNAIVVIENIYRYYQMGKSAEESAIRGAHEVGIAITASTLTSVVVFIPVLYMETGEMASYMRQFAFPMGVSLFASLFVALTLIPLAFSRMKPREELRIHKAWRAFVEGTGLTRLAPRRESRLGRIVGVHPLVWCIHLYSVLLDHSLRKKALVLVAMAVVVVVTFMIPGKRVGMQQMPPLDMREVDIEIKLEQNFDLAMARDTFELLKENINKQREELDIKNVFTRVSPTGGSLEVYLLKPEDYTGGKKSKYSTQDVLNILSERMPKRLPGVEVRLSIPEGSQDGGAAKTVSVRLMGNDSKPLYEYAQQFKRIMGEIPNISDVEVNTERAKQEIQLQVDNALATNAGISPFIIARTVDVALRGNRLPSIKQGGREYPVWAQFREEDRKTRANLDNVTVMGARGVIPLSRLVNYTKSTSPARIERIDGKNVVQVTGKIATDDLRKVQTELQRRIASFELPLGYTIGLGDQFTEMQTSVANFIMTLILALILVYIVMASLFESLLLPLSIMTSVPLAFIGVYWALFATQTPFDTVGLIGCILMVGVIVNNGIVIVDHINFLRKEGMERHAAVLQAGRDRFRPVWMTALTTILGSVPLAMEGNAGNSISFICLGRAFIGGLTIGTVLTLVVVPVLYVLIDDAQEWLFRYLASLRRLGRRQATPAEESSTEIA